jgi:hypothetical protein
MAIDNLKLLPWLVHSGNDRDQIAAFILQQQGLPHQPANSQSALSKWRKAIEEREGGRPFELA